MKRAAIVCLCVSLLLQGCMAGHSLTTEERAARLPKPDERAWFVLRDGRTITVEAYHHIRVDDPADMVFISGEEIHLAARTTRDVALTIPAGVFDSLLARGDSTRNIPDGTIVLPITDSTKVSFTRANSLRISREDGAGYGCIGRSETRHKNEAFSGFVRLEEIDEITVGRPSPIPILVLIGVIGAVVAVFFMTFEFCLSCY